MSNRVPQMSFIFTDTDTSICWHSSVKSKALIRVGDIHGCKSVASGGMSPSVMELLRFHKSNKIHINPI